MGAEPIRAAVRWAMHEAIGSKELIDSKELYIMTFSGVENTPTAGDMDSFTMSK